MKKDFIKVVLIFAICLVLAFGACLLCACLFDRVSPLASAETVTLPDDGVVGDNILFDSRYNLMYTSPYWKDSARTSTSLLSDSLLLYSTASTGGNFQYIYDFPLDDVPVVGNTYTLSIYSDGVVRSAIQSNLNVTDYTGSNIALDSLGSVVRLRYNSSFNRFVIQFVCNLSAEIHVVWVKFELGNQFTGYVPNYHEIEQDTLSDYFDYNAGWTNFSVMGDFLHNDSQLEFLSSPNGGSIFYSDNTLGTLLQSNSNGTQFVYSPNQAEFMSSNSSHTVAILLNGTFSSGDVVLSLKYTKYLGTDDFWQGSNPIAMNDQYTLTNGLSIFHYVGNNAAKMTLTLRSGVSVYLKAFKVETGAFFTRFPYSTVLDQSSFTNGYNAGLIAGTEQGYSQGLTQGYDDGFDEGFARGDTQGHARGYNEGVLTGEEGTWSNLISSLINVPVTFLLSLIHFEILGFDFANVFRIIVLFSLLSFIISKVLKGII